MKYLKNILIGSALTFAVQANAALIQTDFSNSNGFTILGNASVGNSEGTLTPNSNSQRGAFLFDDVNFGSTITEWSATFDFTITTTQTSGADGFSFGLYSSNSPFNLNSFYGEEGATSGLSVGFDTYKNGWDVSGNSVSINFNGNIIQQFNLDNILALENSGTNTATITNSGGMMSLMIGQNSIFSNFSVSGWQPVSGNFYFAGRTGGARSLQVIDNVSITAVSEPSVIALLGLAFVGLLRRRITKA